MARGGKDDQADNKTDIPHTRDEPRPDFSKPPPPAKLPRTMQATLDDEDKLWSTLYEGRGTDSTNTEYRYAAYASRVRTILLSAHRYVAYTSDIGESFRPIAHPYLIRGAYGISWAYLIGDVSHEGYKAYIRNQRVLNPAAFAGANPTGVTAADTSKGNPAQTGAPEGGIAAVALAATKDLVQPTPGKVAPVDDYRTVMVQRALFQGLASMGLPAFTILSIVKYSGKALKQAGNKTIRTWGPIGLGLAAVPALPYMFDAPVEHAVEWTFHKGFELVGGKGAVSGDDNESKKEL